MDLPLRFNIDPDGGATDTELWSVLEQTRCKRFVEQLEGGLDHEVVVNGGTFSRVCSLPFELLNSQWTKSQGTRQLIALSRALLQKPKLLALDEASSRCVSRLVLHRKPHLMALSLDVDTDNAIQETLRSGFGRDTTLIVVAHRISTIRDMVRRGNAKFTAS